MYMYHVQYAESESVSHYVATYLCLDYTMNMHKLEI